MMSSNEEPNVSQDSASRNTISLRILTLLFRTKHIATVRSWGATRRKSRKTAATGQDTATLALQSVPQGLGPPDGGIREMLQPAGEPARTGVPSPRFVDGKTAKLKYCSSLLHRLARLLYYLCWFFFLSTVL